jgi:DNA replication factor GINS
MVPSEEMGFTFIQQVQQRERRSHNLTKLPADFFENLTDHISNLRRLNREENARDPMSTTATLVQNELRNTLQMVQDIVHLRLGKMANRAVDSLRGSKVDLHSLTPREKEVYQELARLMASARDSLAPAEGAVPQSSTVPSRDRPAPEAVGKATPGSPVAPARSEGPATGKGEPIEAGAMASSPETLEGGNDEATVLLHVLSDLPSFAGEGGRMYSLRKGDLVTMPQRLADVLIAKGIAEGVEPGKGED